MISRGAIARMESNRNSATQFVRAHLAAYSEDQLMGMLTAMAEKKAYPPLWYAPLPVNVCPLISPTILAEIQRRWEVAELEGR